MKKLVSPRTLGRIVIATGALLIAAVAVAQHSIAYFDPRDTRLMSEVLKTEAPAYPFVAKYRHWQGSGVFRLRIDQSTGRVMDVRVRKSTGFRVLDDSSIIALRSWVFRPNHFKEADVPITFKLSRQYDRWPNLPPGSKALPPSPY
jgi:TonB family protein